MMQTVDHQSGLCYKTLKNESPQGKAKVYFCADAQGFAMYFEEICQDIFQTQPGCAIFYRDYSTPVPDTEAFYDMLRQMQLFVMPTTENLLRVANQAIGEEYPFALTEKIPVLPIMMESGLENLFNAKCGTLQFLDKCSKDPTAIPYPDKLRSYLESVLVGETLTRKVRDAFDTYVFLSYRKKDRKQAQKLMRLIHEIDRFQDIAIWYDEFLVPGENFNTAIQDAMQRCSVFTMLVTPNLVNEENYVQREEYPCAVSAKKPILPVEAEKTDRVLLEKLYPGIPACTEEKREKLLPDMGRKLSSIALRENDSDPMHLFFIGLAYLSGIDVERNPDRGVKLLMRAAEDDLPEACGKLADVYKTGDGVQADPEEGLRWRDRQVEILGKTYWETREDAAGDRFFDALMLYSDELLMQYREIEAMGKSATARNMTMDRLEADPENPKLCKQMADVKLCSGRVQVRAGGAERGFNFLRESLELREKLDASGDFLLSEDEKACYYTGLSVAAGKCGQYGQAEFYAKQDLLLAEAQNDGTVQARESLQISLSRYGSILDRQHKYAEAMSYKEQALSMAESLHAETGTADALIDLSQCYFELADTVDWLGDRTKCFALIAKAKDLSEQACKKEDRTPHKLHLANMYSQMSAVARAQKNLPEAEEWIRKSVAIVAPLEEMMSSTEVHYWLQQYQFALARVLRQQEKYAEAEQILEKFQHDWGALDFVYDVEHARLELRKKYELGLIYEAQKKIREAHDVFIKTVDRGERYLKDYQDTGLQSDVADYYTKLGDFFAAHYGGAEEKQYLRSLELRQAVYEKDKSAYALQALAGGYLDAGDYFSNEGDENGDEKEYKKAEAYYEKCLTSYQALAQQVSWSGVQRKLMIAYARMGQIRERLGKLEPAEVMYEKAAEIAVKRAKQNATEQTRDDLAVQYRRLARISEKLQNTEKFERYTALANDINA